jgi:redox-sensitive bicupin YhaK (pirin superfamily)
MTIIDNNDINSSERGVAHRFPADVRREGAGTHITRWFVPTDYALTDPFLLFDETKSDKIEEYAGGFPEHPHRGFEALTYMIAGTLRHKDSAGFTGYVGPLGAQWLTNASGLTHDEVPDQTEGLFWCLQLWINLPAVNKADTPFYNESSEEEAPVLLQESGAEIRVIAGDFEKSSGPLPPVARPSKPVYLDVTLKQGDKFTYLPPEGYTVLVFIVEGEITIKSDDIANTGDLLLLEKSGGVSVRSKRGSRFLLMAGKPINEDIAWHGPFVMNKEEELQQAFSDFAQFGPFQSDTGTGQNN